MGARITDSLVQEAYEAYKENLSLRKTAEQYGVSRDRLRIRFHKLGLPIIKGVRDVQRSRLAEISDKDGYVLVWLPVYHPLRGMAQKTGYVYKHRLTMAEYLGRPLRDNETVHHLDGDRTHNTIQNLQLRIGNHGPNQAYCCAECGSTNIIPTELK